MKIVDQTSALALALFSIMPLCAWGVPMNLQAEIQVGQATPKLYDLVLKEDGTWVSMDSEGITVRLNPKALDSDRGVLVKAEILRQDEGEIKVLAAPSISTPWNRPAEVTQTTGNGVQVRFKITASPQNTPSPPEKKSNDFDGIPLRNAS